MDADAARADAAVGLYCSVHTATATHSICEIYTRYSGSPGPGQSARGPKLRAFATPCPSPSLLVTAGAGLSEPARATQAALSARRPLSRDAQGRGRRSTSTHTQVRAEVNSGLQGRDLSRALGRYGTTLGANDIYERPTARAYISAYALGCPPGTYEISVRSRLSCVVRCENVRMQNRDRVEIATRASRPPTAVGSYMSVQFGSFRYP